MTQFIKIPQTVDDVIGLLAEAEKAVDSAIKLRDEQSETIRRQAAEIKQRHQDNQALAEEIENLNEELDGARRRSQLMRSPNAELVKDLVREISALRQDGALLRFRLKLVEADKLGKSRLSRFGRWLRKLGC